MRPEAKLSEIKFWLELASKDTRLVNSAAVKSGLPKDEENWSSVVTAILNWLADVKKFT